MTFNDLEKQKPLRQPKPLYQYSPTTDLYQIYIALRTLKAYAASIKASLSWNKYAQYTGARKDDINAKIKTLYEDLSDFEIMLKTFLSQAL
ncbi:MAG: hypothetical protein IK024_10800 [Treponema sp.]|nr:hypothetical protein [Treponema sp.]